MELLLPITALYQVWQQQKPPVGITLTEEDYTALALSIALKSDTATSVLQQQQDRINNTDRKKRLAFIAPALSPGFFGKRPVFLQLTATQHREKEACVIAALHTCIILCGKALLKNIYPKA